MLISEGKWADIKQAGLPCGILAQAHEAALWSWENIDVDAEFKGNYTRIFQEIFEPCEEYLEKLTDAFQKQVKGKETHQH